MKKKFRKVAKAAGFCFFKDEPYGPGRNHIDPASLEGDEQMVRFIQMLGAAVMARIETSVGVSGNLPYEIGYRHGVEEALFHIQQYFDVDIDL